MSDLWELIHFIHRSILFLLAGVWICVDFEVQLLGLDTLVALSCVCLNVRRALDSISSYLLLILSGLSFKQASLRFIYASADATFIVVVIIIILLISLLFITIVNFWRLSMQYLDFCCLN